MITGSLAAIALNIDRIKKRKSDIVLLLSESCQAHGYWAFEHAVLAWPPLCGSDSLRMAEVGINSAPQSFLLGLGAVPECNQ